MNAISTYCDAGLHDQCASVVHNRLGRKFDRCMCTCHQPPGDRPKKSLPSMSTGGSAATWRAT